ncbi:O-antigen ligase family protein [Candidatus Microgenomates bacterium]|nr:O-antigen ligase family protein [Candidatus Microgenomates bacterium]
MISNLFKILLFLIPLVFFKNTSELFEFNKIITLYIFTILIGTSWVVNSIKAKKLIFRHTILDIPVVLYLSALILSTIFSLDSNTSLLGYYSRFNGGLISQICYSLLYWAFVSNVKKDQIKKIVWYLISGLLLSSILAILEHFHIGITCGVMGLGWSTDCWVQDVASRVYSTFGQPNWLAAFLSLTMPLTWVIIVDQNTSTNRRIVWTIISVVFFTTLLFTKSRSGLLGFGVSTIVFWSLYFKTYNFSKTKHKRRLLKIFVILNSLFLLVFFTTKLPKTNNAPVPQTGPALETGGTESGEIRKNVWTGAIETWKRYPILGTGVETFAFAYPMHKPLAHNLVSEWDFIYNKAHNEYLNYLATTGTFGFLSYMVLIATSFILIYKTKKYEYLAGYLSILATNFFGFSVVPVSLLTFLLPAMATVSTAQDTKKSGEKQKLNTGQKLALFTTIIVSITFLFMVGKYWYADLFYNKAKLLNKSGNFTKASELLQKAITLNPKEPIFLTELSMSFAEVALMSAQSDNIEKATKDVGSSIEMSQKAYTMAPYNINVKKVYSGVLAKLSQFDRNYLNTSISVIESAIVISPTDPKLHYQLGLMYLKTGQNQKGLNTLEKTVLLKPNYKEGRFALGLTYKDFEMPQKAREQFEYILNNIDPKDELTKKYLQELN